MEIIITQNIFMSLSAQRYITIVLNYSICMVFLGNLYHVFSAFLTDSYFRAYNKDKVDLYLTMTTGDHMDTNR